MPTTATATALVATTVATGPTALATAMDSATARGRLRLSPRLSLLRIRIRPWRLLRWLQDLRSWLRLRPRSVLRQEGGRALLRLRCPRCCPCCEHLRRRPCRVSRRRPRPVSHAVHPVVSSYAQVSPSASLSTVGIAPAAIPAVGGAYAGAGRYVANSAGTVHVAKREAEADPYYYGGYHGHGLGYRTYGGYGLGYGRGYYWG